MIVFLSDIMKRRVRIYRARLSHACQVLLKRHMLLIRLFHGGIRRSGRLIGWVDRVESVHVQSAGLALSLFRYSRLLSKT
ncbi:hypothetical protein BwSF12_74890 [Bradyrhizobium ottawaense]|uniref:Uncharacterized protein n=2 Tax=Bradyrhizobium diazoefficiens TaxID=1355477 RepID=A0A809YAD3_9BRAD|nr:hypothetical protein H12S4_19290 [Bradyrhizobium diazoefficiens]GEC50393.1 hypothetical protein BJA01nite_80350 [Bradyrhizobium japonicum]GMO57983.1 hypothetical protein BwSF12_74890 [Bradyrhizobium ottawaense]BCA01336.1 hypothetical protein H12S4_22400 [Bradyrhizobium diazoefficiens]BCE36877.1 hypothetical protein XF3B_19080 [Bradyrhizobium diazoefficiens]